MFQMAEKALDAEDHISREESKTRSRAVLTGVWLAGLVPILGLVATIWLAYLGVDDGATIAGIVTVISVLPKIIEAVRNGPAGRPRGDETD
ncbi:hypothetical protein BJF86_15700 [Serinicoccus sp. CNJ-927]|uniref:hypothetical protein n=1 Tax=Serinicoccus sp. CNJ-927 TaxID=1904970 RepID=UPI00095D140B|nr:hypothetical protein [Serinicoccus sp. CNJ-927]OLT41393.1 hypothetical protein BJF86_15700 [Serinicoccus sp. CNJ-927]